MEELNKYSDQAIKMAIDYAPKLALAIAVLLIGLWIIKTISNLIGKTLEKSNISKDVQPFLRTLVDVTLKVLLVFSVAGMVGIETTSFVAVLAAAGFAVGMALQGSLSNFAAGVMVLVFKPYKIEDIIKIEDEMGHVEEIQIFNTIIKTFDNKTVIIPNSTAISGIITNLSTKEFIRVDLNVHIPYAEDFPKVKEILERALRNTPKVLSAPAPFVGIESFDSHNVILSARPYTKADDYWDVYYAANQNIKAALAENNIQVAYSEGIELGKIGG